MEEIIRLLGTGNMAEVEKHWLNSAHHANNSVDNGFLKPAHLRNYKPHRCGGGPKSLIGLVVSSPRNGKDKIFRRYRFIW